MCADYCFAVMQFTIWANHWFWSRMTMTRAEVEAWTTHGILPADIAGPTATQVRASLCFI